MIEKPCPELPLTAQCELLGLGRSSLYYKKASVSEENLALLHRLDELHTDKPSWGSRTLRDVLRNEGHKVNRKRIQRLMEIAGINAVFPGPNLSKRRQEHQVYPYLLRDVPITHVNQVWSTDITYIRLSQGWAYLVAIIDWRSRAILAWRLSNTCDRFFCIEALEEAIRLHGKPKTFNTDQGATFTSPDFAQVLLGHGIQISMDGKGRALDNVYIERFWRSLKYDEVYLKSYSDLKEAREQIGAYIVCYNNFRPHASLKGMRPMEVYLQKDGLPHAA
jgi:putative transposase